MQLTINGEPRMLEEGLSVAGMLAVLAVDVKQAAVERNLEIVPKSLHADTLLQAGDQIEIVGFIGGG